LVSTYKAIGWHHDLFLGWEGLAAGGVQVHNIPGDHITLIAEPNVRILAETLRESLSKVRQESEVNNPVTDSVMGSRR
jgi:thioesterase domain-containing protein